MNRVLAVLICMLVMASCSGDSSGPVDDGDNGNEIETFEVIYTAENDRAADELISAASGGTVEATGSNGVLYRLLIPAGAIESDTLVTITPVSGLTVTGPGTFICAGSCAELDCCVTGALFEPEGLEFDSLVTLEIIFPAGEEFPFDSVGTVFMFDSPFSVIGACESEIDFSAKTLTARIWHFSGYGTGAADCERLTGLYLAMKANAEGTAGTAGFFYALGDLVQVTSLNRACDPFGNNCHEMCEGLNAMVMPAALMALQSHRGAVLSLHPASPTSPGDIDDLVEELRRAQHFSQVAGLSSEIQSFTEALLGRILAMARTLADEAQYLCSSGDCSDGEYLLDYVLSLGQRGIITDSAFLSDVEDWREDCCSFWRLSMTADKTEILRAVVNGGDMDMCVCTLTLKLTTSSGQPVQGEYINCKWDYYSAIHLPGGETDENGEVEVFITSLYLGSGEKFYCTEMVQGAVIAEAYNSETSEYATSDPIMLTFRNFTVSTTVNYTYTAVKDVDAENFGTTTCTITGGGTNYANTIGNCGTTCSGVITRTYNSSGCSNGECGTSTIIGGSETSGCLLRPNLDYVDRGDGVQIPVLLGLNFMATPITDGVDIQYCIDGADCVDFWTDLRSRVEWPGYGGVPDYWEISPTGTFEPLTWTFSETSDISSKEATLTITVEANY
jgi:hypothetical protein